MLEEAQADMVSAAEAGSGLARQQCTRFNPYAALCSQVLADTFTLLSAPPRDDGCDHDTIANDKVTGILPRSHAS